MVVFNYKEKKKDGWTKPNNLNSHFGPDEQNMQIYCENSNAE